LALLLAGGCAWGQNAISAHSGLIHYVEGKVLLEGQPVEPKFGEFPDVRNDQVLETQEGRAEVLLTPGVFLRLSENSSFKMLSNRLSDTALEVLSGSAMVEVDQLLKDNAITVKYKDATIALRKQGLYRVDAEPSLLRVYDGEAEVINGAKTIVAHKGRQVQLDDTLVATSFDTKDTDSFYRWASRRSEYIAAANVSSARAAGNAGLSNGVPCNGQTSTGSFATSNGAPCTYGSYGYGSPYGSWAWNPYFGMFTYLPGYGYGYNPFGWAFYSPYTVGALYVPGYYGGYGPGYVNTAGGPTALSGARQSPASLSNSGGSSALRASGTPAASSTNASTSSSSGQVRSTGGGTVSGGSVGGASLGSSGGGAARSGGGARR
jgi:hypothetical protein